MIVIIVIVIIVVKIVTIVMMIEMIIMILTAIRGLVKKNDIFLGIFPKSPDPPPLPPLLGNPVYKKKLV